MQYVNLGKTGMKVSRLCLGMMSYGSKQWREWVLEEADAKPFVKRALDAGINFFDTADVYSLGESERVTGKLFKDLGVRRENVVVASKVNGQMSDDINDRGLSRKHIMDSIDKSLQRLQMDYVDLYQIHRWDYEVPIEETLEALNDIVRAGKARYIGASSMFAWQFAKALDTSEKHGWTKFVSMQDHYNLAYREEEREMIPLCVNEGIGIIPWSLARKLLWHGSCISRMFIVRSSAQPKWITLIKPLQRSTSNSLMMKSKSWKNPTSRTPSWGMRKIVALGLQIRF